MGRPDRRSRWRTLAMLAGVVAIYAAAGNLPLPGLDRSATPVSDGTARRWSIIALGIAPYFTVLTLAEIARLIAPALPRWEAASAANRRRVMLILAGSALLMAAADGAAIAEALHVGGLTVASPTMGAWQVVALVAGTAAMIGLVRLVRLPDLGDGLWLLVILPFVTTLPARFGDWIDVARVGGVSAGRLLAAFGFLVGAALAAAFVDAALRRSTIGRRTDWPGATAILVWPPFLAAIVTGPVLLLWSASFSISSVAAIDMAGAAFTAAGIGGFVFCYARRIGALDEAARSTLVMVAAIQIAIVVGAAALPHLVALPLFVNGGTLIATTAVMMALVRAWGARDPTAETSRD